jgi:hypothetical protein
MGINLAYNFKLVQGIQPRTTNGGFTSDVVSLKNYKKATIIVELTQAVGHATAFTLNQYDAVGGTGKVLTGDVLVWANEDTATNDTLVRKTDAKSYTVAADVKNKTIVFEVEPSIALDLGNNYDCIALVVANSGQATNFASITFVLEPRYQQATPPSAIVD